MKKNYFYSTIPIVLVLVLSACGSNATPTPIPTLVLDTGNKNANTVELIPLGGDIVASAVIVPAQEAHLAFVSGGSVAKVNVTIGEHVKAGQVMVELDNTILQLDVERTERTLRELTSPASVAAAEQALANAQKTYDDAKKKADNIGRRYADNVTVDYLQAQLVLAQNALDMARDAYRQTARLSDADPAKARAATNLYNAQKAYNTALGNLEWYTDTPSQNETAIITADFNAASAALQEAKWYLSELKGESIPADATGAQLAQLQQARDNLQAAQERLGQSRLIAPVSGVVADVNVNAGDFASPGVPLVVVISMDSLLVKTTDLSERDITRVKVGSSAKIMVKAMNQEFNGKVTSISPLASTLGGDVVYEITIAFDQQPEGVFAGMTADVSISE